LLFLFPAAIFPQQSADTLETARQLRDQGKNKEAYSLLKKYERHHTTDFNTLWLYGQLSYFTQRFDQAKSVYEKAIALEPANLYIQLDYARILVNLGEYEKAEPYFGRYASYDPSNAEVNSYLSQIAHWRILSRDTLELTRNLRNEGKMGQAFRLAKKYYKNHSTDLNARWLFAQVSYFNNRFGKSKSLYEMTIRSAPKNLYLQLDYGKMLVNIGEFEKAKPYLKTYLDYEPGNSQVFASLAKIDYWQGDYNAALKKIEKAQPSESESRDIHMLCENILIAKSPWINITEGYLTDDQPLQTYTTQIQGGMFLHPLSFLHFDLEVPVFRKESATYSAFWFQAGNKSIIGKAGINIDAGIGMIKFPVGNNFNWTGNLSFEKKLFRHLKITLNAERSPYFYTVRSIDTAIIENRYAAKVRWEKFRSWSGEIAFDFHRFPFDKNNLYTLYGWVFTPPLRLSVFEFRIGYSFNHSTTDKLNFVPEKTLAEILANYDASEPIKGIYDPYFTPRDQVSHSAIIGIGIFPWKPVDLSVNASFGILGSAMIPYFYLDKNAIISQGLVKEKYQPIQVNALANIHLSGIIKLQVFYTYHRTYYFTSNYAGIGMRISLWHGTKKK